jgi:glycosidase
MNNYWWKEAIVYHIYPRSFKDSNNDGIGDLNGIIAKLDYLNDLGITTIYVSELFETNCGETYCGSKDFKEINTDYGTKEDFIRLINALHQRDMKLLIDLELNHTSIEHPWFLESRISKDNPYRDYYIWRKGIVVDEPPTNWLSLVGDSVWQYDEKTDEYYLHVYTKKTADLNWHNKRVREELHEIINYWLDLGIDGFIFKGANLLDKNTSFPDLPIPKDEDVLPIYTEYLNRPLDHSYLHDINLLVSKCNGISVGEMTLTEGEELYSYIDQENHELNMVLTQVTNDHPKPFQHIKEYIQTIQSHSEGWFASRWSNQRESRIISQYGDTRVAFHKLSAKMLATVLYLMRGTPFIYQGEEIGMTNTLFKDILYYRDQASLEYYNHELKKGQFTKEELLDHIHKNGRDHARTPMQWDGSQHAGFSETRPWMRVNPNYKEINVAGNL